MIDIYLACPYSHKADIMQRIRFNQINQIAMFLIEKGFVVFSPISHSHPLSLFGDDNSCDYNLWLRQDKVFITLSKILIVAKMPGWKESKGLKGELVRARMRGLEIQYHADSPGYPIIEVM